MSDACQKAHQHTTPCKCLLNCSPAPHQSLIGGESQEDQEVAGCVVFSGTYISLHKRPGQRLTIVKDGERNGPLPTTRSDDDDDVLSYNKYRNSAKRCWSSLFDIFAPSYFLMTNMRVATEEFFLLCVLDVA